MNLTNMPPLTSVPFASGASGTYRNTIPVASQIPTTPGAASYTDGFPPVTFQPIASGGVPPFGADVNGILYAQSVALQWEQAGGNYPFDATFATAIGGYPKDAIVMRADGKGQWLNTVDANTTNPDSSAAAGWIALRANSVTTTIAVTAGSNTPTLNQLGAQVIVLTGSPATAASLILPLTAGAQWLVRNATSGAGAVNVQGATGSVVTIPQGVGYLVYTDGVGYYASSSDVSGLYLPINGTAVAATKLASTRAFNLTGVVTAPGVSFDGTGNVTLATAIADGALSIAKTSGLQTALDAKANLSGANFVGSIGVNFNGSQGTQLQWNVANIEFGETSFVNNRGGGGGGFAWFDRATPGSALGPPLMTLGSQGNLSVPGGITATGGFQVSDRRSKHNIELRPIDTSIAAQLAPLWSQWNRNSDDGFDTGLIAQDVQRIAPQFVKVPDDPEAMLAIDKAGIALECALSAEVRISQLLARIESLEKAA